jgi:hypothetical protein
VRTEKTILPERQYAAATLQMIGRCLISKTAAIQPLKMAAIFYFLMFEWLWLEVILLY